MSERILVIDDEEGIRATLCGILRDEGYIADAAEDAATARHKIAAAEERYDLAILDVWLPDTDGLALLEEFGGGLFEQPVIVISGHGNIDTAVQAIRKGAYDFLEKPLALNRVILTVQNALERHRLSRTVADLESRLDRSENLIGESPEMLQLKSDLGMAAGSTSRILITGENGTGKELVARQIHRQSKRRDQPFVDVNCAAIPEELIESELFGHVKGAFTGAAENRRGRFEAADGGTLFLDEIGDMSMKTQAKVLRVLEQQRFERVGGTEPIEVDVRVLAATNKELAETEIPAGRFREDLFFRLAVIPLRVPPLRERREDIPRLLQHFLEHFSAEVGRRPKSISPGALERLRDHHWPGNVRELRNLSERLVIMTRGDEIAASDLPAHIGGASATQDSVQIPDGATLKEAREAFEREFIERRLQQSRGNVSQAARSLGLERSNLYRKMRTYGVEVARDEPTAPKSPQESPL